MLVTGRNRRADFDETDRVCENSDELHWVLAAWLVGCVSVDCVGGCYFAFSSSFACRRTEQMITTKEESASIGPCM